MTMTAVLDTGTNPNLFKKVLFVASLGHKYHHKEGDTPAVCGKYTIGGKTGDTPGSPIKTENS